jgi:hypothetical protein
MKRHSHKWIIDRTWNKRYDNLMQEYSAAKKLLGLKPGQSPKDILALSSGNETK